MKIRLVTGPEIPHHYELVAKYGTETRRLHPMSTEFIEAPAGKDLLISLGNDPDAQAGYTKLNFDADVKIQLNGRQIKLDVLPLRG